MYVSLHRYWSCAHSETREALLIGQVTAVEILASVATVTQCNTDQAAGCLRKELQENDRQGEEDRL